MQQQMKQTSRRCAGGAAARQAGAATKQNASVTALGAGSSPAILGLPPGGFATILVDPPWPLQSGEKHYRTMSLARIKALPVGRLAARDAHLWLWTTNALLPKAYEVAEAWGFTVRSPLTWVKFRLGLGGRYQLRNATEQLLFCTRGRAPLGSRSQPTWFNAPVTEHSRKPAEQFAIIERVSPGQCGATKWTQISASPALLCRGTASGCTRQTPRQRPRQRSERNRCRRRWLVHRVATTEMKPLTVTARRPCDESAVARQVPNLQSSRRW